MADFFDALVLYWNGFSGLSQNFIGWLGAAIFGREISSQATQWVFYGLIVVVLIALMKMRSARLRHQIETRQRFDI